MNNIKIIGGGLAGCEAAWQLAKAGVSVELFEMKPSVFSPAHKSPLLSELVCSNSLRSNLPGNAVGLLKEEMRQLGSLIMEAADATSVPAGGALAVDRGLFSGFIEERIHSTPGIAVRRKECTSIPDDAIVILASGPLTSDPLAKSISSLVASEYLYFYDAISPIVHSESIDYAKVFFASRYGKGDADYLNCPMTEQEYDNFYSELLKAEKVASKAFEDEKCFEGCLPIEVLAERGKKTLLFGPMKPVGLIDPRTGGQPHAVIQLRKENLESTLFNIVGFQTKLTWPEQRRIFRLIPGLENAEFARLGSIHRNTFINSPRLLMPSLQLRSNEDLFFAGQISGVEGYVESAAMGLLAGIFSRYYARGIKIPVPPRETALGALIAHITNTEYKTFQPMNVNFGLFPPLAVKCRKKDRGNMYFSRAMKRQNDWIDSQLISSYANR